MFRRASIFLIFLAQYRGVTMSGTAKPKLIVFDLDYTMWPFWVDTHVDAPFHLASDNKIRDARGRHVKCYPDVPEMLARLRSEGYVLGLASRTSYTKEAKHLVELFDWEKYIAYKEIYPGCKIQHFERFHEESGVPYSSMLFFDDEYRNVHDVSTLGVTCFHAEDGMSNEVLEIGLKKFAAKSKSL